MNMWEILNGMAAFTVPILALLVAWLVFKEHVKSRKADNYWKQRKEDIEAEELRNKVAAAELKIHFQEGFSILHKELSKYTKTTMHEADINQIWEQLEEISETVKDLKHNQKQDELRSLSRDIVKFAEDLRKGNQKSRNSFQNISYSYQRYKKLGGNNYIDQEWEYIREAMKNENY